MRSVYKYSALNVLLMEVAVSFDIGKKRVFQRFAES